MLFPPCLRNGRACRKVSRDTASRAEQETDSRRPVDFEYANTDEVPNEPDFWEGEKWEWVGRGTVLLIPVLVLVGVFVGGFAAKTYNEGAEYDPYYL
jgi:hypothetical protein